MLENQLQSNIETLTENGDDDVIMATEEPIDQLKDHPKNDEYLNMIKLIKYVF
jgi:hypothetical protein